MKKIITVLLSCIMLISLTGCAMFESKINDIKGNLVGNGYTIDTFDNYGQQQEIKSIFKVILQKQLLMIVMEVLLQDMNYLQLLPLPLMVKKLNLVEIHVSLLKKDQNQMLILLKKTQKVMIMENFQIIHISLILLISIKTTLVNQELLLLSLNQVNQLQLIQEMKFIGQFLKSYLK